MHRSPEASFVRRWTKENFKGKLNGKYVNFIKWNHIYLIRAINRCRIDPNKRLSLIEKRISELLIAMPNFYFKLSFDRHCMSDALKNITRFFADLIIEIRSSMIYMTYTIVI